MADRFWRGGTAAWDGTAGTKWADTVGGAGGASVPTSADDVFFDATSGVVTCTISGSQQAASINCTGFTGTLAGTGSVTVSGSVTLVAGMGFTNQGTFTINGTGTFTSAGKTIGGSSTGGLVVSGAGITVTLGSDLTLGSTVGSTFINLTLTQGTLALNGFTVICSRFSSSNSNTRAIAFGSTNIQVRGTGVLVSMANATGFTCTGTGGFARVVSLSGTSEFSFGSTSGGSASNAPNLTATSTGNTLTLTNGSYFKNVSFTGSTSTVTGTYNACGDLTLGSGGTYTSVVPTFLASGTITSAGRELGSTTVNGSGITVTLADAMTLSSADALTLTQGTFTTANFNVTAGSFSSSNSNTRTLNMGSGTWTLTANSPTVWNTGTTTGLTFAPSTSTISMTSASAKTFAGGGLTYYNLNQGGAGALTIVGSNTFNNITNSVQPATVTFSSGTTQTVANFGLSGTAGNLITINSTASGTQFTLSKASGTVTAQYLAIQDSNATGGATWDALSPTNTNLGNNTGWVFPSSGAFMQFF